MREDDRRNVTTSKFNMNSVVKDTPWFYPATTWGNETHEPLTGKILGPDESADYNQSVEL